MGRFALPVHRVDCIPLVRLCIVHPDHPGVEPFRALRDVAVKGKLRRVGYEPICQHCRLECGGRVVADDLQEANIATNDDAEAITPATMKKLHGQFGATFGGLDVEAARHWYAAAWTAEHTSTVRESSKDLTDAEALAMIADMKKNTKGIRDAFILDSEAETVPA